MKTRVEVTEVDLTPPDEAQELLTQVRDYLREKLPCSPGLLGPHWYQSSLRDGFWILEFDGRSPNDGHEATWIEVDFEYMEITIADRRSGRTARMDFSLYEEDCFERLANATRDAAMGKF